ncbi:MAG TPA: 3-hydroxyacyl-CoA dehydrogenase NAD-binding domain-containing protein, partial [Vicinamibacterales bacterium]|nr:3-hydroxyacyl-CoA dehydrogenase NAD-binding domain-containing protein [Vicinamibacterales bacterium]
MEVMRFRSVAVLGAGTMGAQIAAHFANAGVPSLLLDLTPDMARQGLERARTLRPNPFFTPDRTRLITIGDFDQDLAKVANADWIIEAVVERADAKRDLLARVDGLRRAGSIVSTNTSGLPIAALAAGRSDDFRRHWLGTHFFNPPRYLRLLEIVPTPDTDPAVVSAVRRFAEERLGKGTVVAKDTPNFIANHIALYGMLRSIEALEAGRYSVEEIDAITGPALGRPKSATFRTADLAGLDVLAHVVRTLYDHLPEAERDLFRTPHLLDEMLSRGWLGDKTGQGFYRRERAAGLESQISALDPGTMTYRPRQSPHLTALEMTKAIEDVRERVRTLFGGADKVGAFLRETLAPTLVYTARVAPLIAHSIDDVDRVMQWGFGWELGPFELLDAIGVSQVVDAWRARAGDAADVPPMLREAMDRGRTRIRESPLPPSAPDLLILRTAKEGSRVVRRNAGASLVDLGDGVLCVEFHSKMNAIGADTVAMVQAGVAEAERNFAALVVGNDAPNFSAGANLMLLLLEAHDGNWDEIDLMVRTFQRATMSLRYAQVPVVAAPAGLTLGGGCEVVLHADRVQAAAETYVGLVEVGVGLIPAGAGTKEMLARAVEPLESTADLQPAVQRVFETIGFARVSTSAHDAIGIGYLRDVDGVSMNRERLMTDAKRRALERVRDGYQAPQRRAAIRVGGESLRAT